MLRSKCFNLLFMSIALGLAIGARAIEGQTMSLFRRFSAPGLETVAADASGIYVFWNAGVSKYDARGNELWTRELGASTNIKGAATDATGVYGLGSAGPANQFFLRKYSTGGDELWTRRLEFSAFMLFPHRGGVVADATGVYVAGGDPLPGTFSYLRKYSSDGAELWTRRFDGSRGGVAGVAVDATGVYVMNQNGAAGPPVRTAGVVVRKWDAGGNELWTRELNPSDVPRTLAAADPTGFYVVAADAWGTGTFLRKYDSGGNELWSRPAPEGSVAVDATGIYLVGTTRPAGLPHYSSSNPSAPPGQCRSGWGDAYVRKYDPDGDPVWARQFGTSQANGAIGVALDSSGVYVAGG